MKTLETDIWKNEAITLIAKLDTQLDELAQLPLSDLQAIPAPKKWSALTCIEHLNRTYAHYGPAIAKALDEARRKQHQPVSEFKVGRLGRYSIKRLKPQNGNIPSPMKTFRGMDPEQDDKVNPDAIGIMKRNHAELRRLILEAKLHDPGAVKVQSLISFIRFRLGDAVDFLLAHEERHLLQALRAAGLRA